MRITRQHESTTVHELAAATCTKLLGIGPGKGGGFCAFYLEANEAWYRFFVQQGILFWDPSPPDPEDDLAPGEGYEDVLTMCGIVGSTRIGRVTMFAGRLTIAFVDGRELGFQETDETGGMRVSRPIDL